MPSANPALSFGRPLRPPAEFEPSQSWIDGNYVYRYDATRAICKRSPINARVGVGTMFFSATAAASEAAGEASRNHYSNMSTRRVLEYLYLSSGFKKRRRVPQPARQPRAAALGYRATWLHRTIMALLWVVILAAAALFVYPLWPAIAYRLDPPKVSLPVVPAATIPTPSASGVTPAAATTPNVQPITSNRLYIPSIGVDTPIVEGPSLNILNKVEGIWHQTGGAANNLVLAGHRYKYLPPNTSTLYELNQVKVGDLIGLDWLGKRTIYRVFQTEVVPANDVAIVNPTSAPQLTVYSCNDVLMTHRVVVLARPIP